MKKRVLSLSIQAMFSRHYPSAYADCRPMDYLQPGALIKVRLRGKANSDDIQDFRVLLRPGNFPNGK